MAEPITVQITFLNRRPVHVSLADQEGQSKQIEWEEFESMTDRNSNLLGDVLEELKDRLEE